MLWGETGICTTATAGVEVQASGERFAEIKSGRTCEPAVGGPSGKDPRADSLAKRRPREATGLAHEAVVAMKEG